MERIQRQACTDVAYTSWTNEELIAEIEMLRAALHQVKNLAAAEKMRLQFIDQVREFFHGGEATRTEAK